MSYLQELLIYGFMETLLFKYIINMLIAKKTEDWEVAEILMNKQIKCNNEKEIILW